MIIPKYEHNGTMAHYVVFPRRARGCGFELRLWRIMNFEIAKLKVTNIFKGWAKSHRHFSPTLNLKKVDLLFFFIYFISFSRNCWGWKRRFSPEGHGGEGWPVSISCISNEKDKKIIEILRTVFLCRIKTGFCYGVTVYFVIQPSRTLKKKGSR